MAAGGTDTMASKIVEASEAGEKFIEVFYDTLDKRRQVSSTSVAGLGGCTFLINAHL